MRKVHATQNFPHPVQKTEMSETRKNWITDENENAGNLICFHISFERAYLNILNVN